MDETKHSAAVILNRSPYRENDSLITVYTRDFGKMTLAARGTKKISSKLAGHLEPISLADILIIKGRGFDYLGGALMSDGFLMLKEDINKLYYAGRAIDRFDRLVRDGQPDENLFLLLASWLEALDRFPEDFARENGESYLSFFSLRLLAESGYKPEVQTCLGCHQGIKPGSNYLDLKNGGLICGGCFEKRRVSKAFLPNELLPISDNCVKIIRFMLSENLGQIGKLRLDRKTGKELSLIVSGLLAFRD